MNQCPICGGKKSQVRHPLGPGSYRLHGPQKCLTCGLKVQYWTNINFVLAGLLGENLMDEVQKEIDAIYLYELARMKIDINSRRSQASWVRSMKEFLNSVNDSNFRSHAVIVAALAKTAIVAFDEELTSR